MWTDLTKQLVDQLKTLKPYNLASNKSEIAVRCPFCGDSIKSASSTHLYIKLNVQDGEPHTYYCQRCRAKGIVTSELLKMLKIYNSELNVNLGINLKNANKKGNKIVYTVSKANLKLPEYEPDKLSLFKLNYINNRLGINLKLEDLNKFKIFLHLYDLLEYNNIDYLTCKDGMGDTLDNNFMGFISYDNNYLIMRNLSKKKLSNMRYYNYNVYNNYNNTKRFYIIPNKVNYMKDELNIHICEGIFDILGIYHHLVNDEQRKNDLFAAVCGTGYNNVIHEIAKLGFINMNITVYSDADQNIKMYKNLKKEFPFLTDKKITVIYNTIGKDFGVKKEEIKIKKSYI